MENFSLTKVFTGSFAMWILLAVSVVGLAFTFERFMFFIKNRKDIREFCERIKKLISKNDFESVITTCDKEPSPVARMIKNGIKDPSQNTGIMFELMSNIINREKVHMENNVSIIGTISHIAPLIGLLGTVVGIIKSFYSIALSGSGGSEVVAKGVAEALVTTAAGILIAVPAVIIYNYLVRRISVTEQALSIVRDEILTEIKISRGK